VIINYLVTYALPLAFPWILSLLFIGRFIGSKTASKILRVEKDVSADIANRSMWASLLLCVPIALLVPLWSCIHLLAYYVLSVGVQYKVAREIVPELDSKVVWKWSWAANSKTVGWSSLVWIATYAIICVGHANDSQPDLGAIMPGSTFDKQLVESLAKDARAKNNWFKVPAWYAGRWKIGQPISSSRSDQNRWTTHIKDAPTISSAGHFADKTGQIWECEQAGEWSTFVPAADYFGPGLIFKIIRTPIVANDTEYAFKTRSVALELWKNNKQVGGVGQQTSEVTNHFTAPNSARTEMVAAVFTSGGGRILTKKTEYLSTKIGVFVPNLTLMTQCDK
jgi:hypothetical protein